MRGMKTPEAKDIVVSHFVRETRMIGAFTEINDTGDGSDARERTKVASEELQP
jgi:hypothetical protein